MDGDVAPLAQIAALCEQHQAALIVDEAHSTGIDGGGRGLVHELGLGARVHAVVGTLGKSLGAQGAFVAGSTLLIHWLENSARSFIYSTALSPPLAAAAQAAIQVLLDERPDLALWQNIGRIRDRLSSAGLLALVPESARGPILPIVVGAAERALAAQEILERSGVLAVAIRPPTVPAGTSRIRISLRADHDESDLEALVAALLEGARAGVLAARQERIQTWPTTTRPAA
jgi:7-keto-8-aminopelargonate synthetase-like enzyme